MSEATGLSRIELYMNFERPLTLDERATLRDFVARRGKGEPLQLISGKVPFRYITVLVAPNVLIPRPETEVLVSEAFAELKLPRVADHVAAGENGEEVVSPELPELRVVDLCTGSGCIACSIASEYPAAHVVALDIAPEALALAGKNVEVLGLGNRVEVLESDLLGALDPGKKGTFDLIVSNPPYVTTAEMETLDPSVRDYEPHLALWGGDDGLDFYRAIVRNFTPALNPGGWLCFEFGMGQDAAVCDLLRRAGYEIAELKKDTADITRAVLARKREEG